MTGAPPPADAAASAFSRLAAAAGQAHQTGRFAAAQSGYRRLLAVTPAHVTVWRLLAVAVAATDGPETGLRLMMRALRLEPGLRDDNLLIMCRNSAARRQAAGDLQGAVTVSERAICFHPSDAETWRSLGGLFTTRKSFEAALKALERAAALAPGDAQTQEWSGDLHLTMGRPEQAIESLSLSLNIKPNLSVLRRLATAVLYHPSLTEAARDALRRDYAAHYTAATSILPPEPVTRADNPERRLRIGYVGADFWRHPVAFNIEPLLRDRDRGRYGASIYALGDRHDDFSRHLRGLADEWREVEGLDDARLAERIRADDIDVLVILAGGFSGNRACLAAHRAAPVQISMFDGASSGFAAMDHLLSDIRQAPRSAKEAFSERVFRLPSLYVYASPDGPEPSSPPFLRNGCITFGSFNNPAKLNDIALDYWAQALREVPGSRLALKYKDFFADPALRRRVADAFARRGVDAERLFFPADATQTRDDHLRLYHQVDIGLDPFPFSGATTTFEALSMGVPVPTLPQSNMMSRVSSAFLSLVGLQELVASSAEHYISIIRALARDPARLTEYRSSLRDRLAGSPLCDGKKRSRHFHRALRAFWRRRCAASRDGLSSSV